MPTENERKYVLSDPEAILALWPREGWSELRQGYLRGEARIRRAVAGGVSTDSFTYKIDTADRLVEIETALEARDFDDLWPLTGRRIHKLRRSETDARGLHWDIDLFLDPDGGFYLAMAECEMPEGMDAPDAVLPVLADRIRYAVPRERQAEFTNTRLADPAYVAALTFAPR
jgi:CYTH domain-containing protein